MQVPAGKPRKTDSENTCPVPSVKITATLQQRRGFCRIAVPDGSKSV